MICPSLMYVGPSRSAATRSRREMPARRTSGRRSAARATPTAPRRAQPGDGEHAAAGRPPSREGGEPGHLGHDPGPNVRQVPPPGQGLGVVERPRRGVAVAAGVEIGGNCHRRESDRCTAERHLETMALGPHVSVRDRDALGPEPPGVLDLVAGDQTSGGGDHPPPRQVQVAGRSQDADRRPGPTGVAGLGGDLAVGHHVTGTSEPSTATTASSNGVRSDMARNPEFRACGR